MAQALVALIYQLSVAQRESRDSRTVRQLAAVQEMADGLLHDIQSLARTIHPRVLDDLGLLAALNTLIRPLGVEHNVDLRIVLDGDVETYVRALPHDQAYVLYCVAQEGVQNALRHAHPSEIVITLELTWPSATIKVTDNGCGFDPQTTIETGLGTGLFALLERVTLVNGSFAVQSAPGEGTSLFARVPLAESLVSA
jgi:signal transduction histidine kinase